MELEIEKDDLEAYVVLNVHGEGRPEDAIEFVAVPPALKDLQIRLVRGDDMKAVPVITELLRRGEFVKRKSIYGTLENVPR